MSKNKTTVKTAIKDTTTKNIIVTSKDNKKCCKKTISIAIVVGLILVATFVTLKFNKKSTKEKESVKIDRNAPVKNAGDVEDVIATWIANNPELILESVINMQKEQAEKQSEEAGTNIVKNSDKLHESKDDPTNNVKEYDVTVIEFFDYNCGYCKKAVSTIESVAQSEKKVKIIFKELPILGQSSEDLSKVSLAFNIANPSKYLTFHTALMKSSSRTIEDAIKIAQAHGVSAEKIRSVMTEFKVKIEEKINSNRELAQSIGVNGTPAFLVGETLFPGAVGFDTIKQEIEKIRKNK